MTGCASFDRLGSYGFRMADAQVHVGRAGYNIWYHPVDATIIVQERAGGAFGGAIFEGLTLGSVDTSPALNVPRHAAAAYLAQFNCHVVDAYELESITTEIGYECAGDERPSRIDDRPLCASGDPNGQAWRNPVDIVLEQCSD